MIWKDTWLEPSPCQDYDIRKFYLNGMTMAAAAPPSREEMAASVFQQELKTVLHWFSTWSHYQRKDFLTDLVNKAVLPDVTTLFDAMQTLKVNDKAPSIFQCQLKLFTDWFQEWSDEERTLFLGKIQELSSEFMHEFNTQVLARRTEQST